MNVESAKEITITHNHEKKMHNPPTVEEYAATLKEALDADVPLTVLTQMMLYTHVFNMGFTYESRLRMPEFAAKTDEVLEEVRLGFVEAAREAKEQKDPFAAGIQARLERFSRVLSWIAPRGHGVTLHCSKAANFMVAGKMFLMFRRMHFTLDAIFVASKIPMEITRVIRACRASAS